jgi:hypothetical protein
MEILFKEVQRFTEWWLWLILIAIGAISIVGLYKQFVLKKPFGDHPMSNIGLVLSALFIFAFIAFFAVIKLITVIDNKGISIYFSPFVRRKIPWAKIKTAIVADYGFVGYGIRYGNKYGVVYNIKGRLGIAIEKNNGDKMVMGTRQAAEMNRVINTSLSNNQYTLIPGSAL